MLVFQMETGEVVDRCVEFREEVELGETDGQCLKHMYTIRWPEKYIELET